MKLFYVLILFNLQIYLNSQVNFEQIFSFDSFEPFEKIKNIWIDDLDNNGEDEIYIFISNFNSGYWKINCLNLNGNLLWNISQNFSDFSSKIFGQFYNIDDTIYFVSRNIRWEEFEWETDIYYDLIIYDWNHSTLVDSISIFHTTHSMMGCSFSSLNVNQIIPLVVNNSLLWYIGEEYTSGWDEGNMEEVTICDKICLFSLENSTITLLETINEVGKNILGYDDYESIISFGHYNSWSTFPPGYSESSQYLKTITTDIQPNVLDILIIENGFLKFISLNDNFYSDYGLVTLVSENELDYQYRCYSPDFSDTLWVSDQLGFLNDGYFLSNSTCVQTNLGNNFILSFGKKESFPDSLQLEVRNRITGAIVLSQEAEICPEYILETDDNSLYFICVNSSYPNILQAYILQDEIQVYSDDNQINNSVIKLSNFPNPFNPSTTIEFSIDNNSEIELGIYNIKGQKIKKLVHDEFISGSHSIIWNGEDDNKQAVSSGVYLYKLNVNGKAVALKKCLLLK